MDEDELRKFNKADNIIQTNFKTTKDPYNESWEFYEYVMDNIDEAIREKNNAWRVKKPSTITQTNRSAPPPPELTVPIATNVAMTNQPIKDFKQTRYSDDFVNKYKLNPRTVTTDADKDFNKKWNELLRETANLLQQMVGGYNTDKTTVMIQNLTRSVDSSLQFLSRDCKTDYIEKNKQWRYKMTEFQQTKRL